jgi:phosphomannomutase
MQERTTTMAELFERLPKRFSKAALLRQFPRPASQRIVSRFSPLNASVADVVVEGGNLTFLDASGHPAAPCPGEIPHFQRILQELSLLFTAHDGFDAVCRINYTDGIRICFRNGDVAHVRPSGNADELRIYTVADTSPRAEAIARLGVSEPDGLLRQMERLSA